ncbi:DUF6412 domain-containing protein [Nocardia sp. NBC_01503]|uniref:DUF6412 domain-containing protein n=1 Tax=Nocardia sp. NBC_01503 TaxID=2975997 RepID=UPI002E7C4586|nr:DUF6412 domain-containing protein [Nocardia sp. NBC_01503]WTL32416.1 DUF6412 domain-containing protein [Nocardia sp. NBC_01503]
MVTRIRTAVVLVCALVVAAWAVLYLAAAQPNSLIVLGAAALVALTAAAIAARGPVLRAVASVGLPESAERRRRGAFLRQSNPDTAGRPRPRAPGACPA